MLSTIQNMTQILLLQNAIGVILDRIALEIDSHAACVITEGSLYGTSADYVQRMESGIDILQLSEFPVVVLDCQMDNNFIKQAEWGVTLGCSLFVVSEVCALPFLDNFHEIHDWSEQKYAKKVLVVIDSNQMLKSSSLTDILRHRMVINDIPLTLMLQPSIINDWIDIWSAYPYNQYLQLYNRFFLSNSSLLYDKQLISTLTDLEGITVTGAFIHYPPYTAYYRVPPGEGNANEFNSNQSLTIRLDGQEHLILVEFCIKYNCSLTARLDYDKTLWGDSYPNHTGYGLTGSLTLREANVSCAALYLWDNTYLFQQYTAAVQRATITHIVPKPLPLPYWRTPFLPFPGYIWQYVIGAFLIGALSLYIMNARLSKIDTDENEKKPKIYELFDSIYAVFMMSIFQGVYIDIKFLTNITIFTMILIYALVIGNLYMGGLASVMTITQYEKPVDSLEKLVESKFVWGAAALSWIFILRLSDYPPHKKYVDHFKVKPIPDLLHLVQQRKIAIILETMQDGRLTYQEFIDKESSKYYMIMKNSVYWSHTTIMSSKTWPFMDELNRIVLMQQESGIRYYWEYTSGVRTTDYDIQRNIEENGKPPSAEPVRLSYQHILGALLILLLGNALATVCFLFEMLVKHNKKKIGLLRRRTERILKKIK